MKVNTYCPSTMLLDRVKMSEIPQKLLQEFLDFVFKGDFE